MRIVFFSAFQEKRMRLFMAEHPDFSTRSYSGQQQLFIDESTGAFNSYAYYTAKAGHEAHLIVANCEEMQRTWAKENDFPFEKDWKFSVAAAQIKKIRPDIVFMGSLFEYYGAFQEAIRPYCGKLFGWVACPIPAGISFAPFSLMLSSATHYVDDFRKMNVPAEVLPAAFDERYWKKYNAGEQRDIPFAFVGGLSGLHKERVEMLQHLAKKTPIAIWGYGYSRQRSFLEKLLGSDPVLKKLKGEVWGGDMFRILGRTKISFNFHIAESREQAGNMRMFESTGMGALLLTDKKRNDGLWKPGAEMIEYESPKDAEEKVNYFLRHEEERKEVAAAGQQRTLTDFNFEKNVGRMLELFRAYA